MGGYPRLTGGRGPQPGGAQLDFVESCLPWPVQLAAASLNRAFFVRFRVSKAITVTQMTVYIGAASGNLDLGLYSSDGTTLTRLASTGSTAAAGANALQTINLSSSVTLTPGVDYYFGVATDNATLTIGKWIASVNPPGGFKNHALQIGSTFPLPATVAIASTQALGSVIWQAAS